MKISKYIHSCLVVEHNNISFVIDPGNYSYDVFPFDQMGKLDYILITHEHPDHMYLPFLKKLKNMFPQVAVISNESVKKLLEKENIEVRTLGNEFIKLSEAPHEDMGIGHPPQNVTFTLFNTLTHPGDSHHIEASASILALPIQAPWGSYADALKLALLLKPRIIIPIHDWHWRDEARNALYKRASDYFKEHSIEFIGGEKGVILDK